MIYLFVDDYNKMWMPSRFTFKACGACGRAYDGPYPYGWAYDGP